MKLNSGKETRMFWNYFFQGFFLEQSGCLPIIIKAALIVLLAIVLFIAALVLQFS